MSVPGRITKLEEHTSAVRADLRTIKSDLGDMRDVAVRTKLEASRPSELGSRGDCAGMKAEGSA